MRRLTRAAAILLFTAVVSPEVRADDVAGFEKRFGVSVGPAEPVLDLWVRYEALAEGDARRRQHVAQVVLKEFGRYSPAFVGATGLKKIWLAKNVRVAGQSRAAVVLEGRGVLVIDVAAPEDRLYLRHAIHHEYYHLIESAVAGTFYFKDPKWAALNAAGAKYGNGGQFEQDNSSDPGKLVHPAPGFVDRYAASGLEEDKAEVFACLMVPEESQLLATWTRNDPALAAKADYLREFVAWWSDESHAPLRELMAAARDDDANKVQAILAADPSLAIQAAWDGWLPLHWAVVHDAQRVLLVLARFAAVNIPDAQGWTALHVAAASGRLAIAHQLLDLGADPAVKDKAGLTAADRAAATNHPDLAKLLIPP